ncbi:hypothetical protein TNCV_4172721 [Trichonephila clavipes]|nr:hypothetical protein TNCV_4172721 [Trichonephila clavipes]
MPQQLIDTLILSMGRRCETCLAVGRSYPLLKTGCCLLDTHHRDVSALSHIALHATFSIKLLFIPLISLLLGRFLLITVSTKTYMSPSQYGDYDPRLVTEWVRIPSKTWLNLLREKEVGLSPEMDSRIERKSSAPLLVICWDHHL